MIYSIRCSNPNFKSVEFVSGFNIVLADRTKESTKKDSRNGLGKTTLIQIIHFCLGSNVSKSTDWMRGQLLGWTFSIDVDLGGKRFVVSRSTSNSGVVSIRGDWSDWPLRPNTELWNSEGTLPVKDWNRILGWLVFGLPVTREYESDESPAYAPTFRSLISYFVRSTRDAFSTPFEHYRRQFEWDKQVNNAFLLGMDWHYARRWQLLRDREKVLSQMRAAARSGLVQSLSGTLGELETRKVRLDEQLRREREQLDTFQVHPQYRDISERANALTQQIHDALNENVVDERMTEYYESSYSTEQSADKDLVVEVYEEAGVELPELVVRRLDEVETFHQRIVANRKSFLQSEIARLRKRIAERELSIQTLTDERAQLLNILHTYGALEEYTQLEQRYLKTVAGAEEIKQRIDNIRNLERERLALRIDQETLQLEARQDYEERQQIRERAISLFNANSEALYAAPGKLIIDVEPSGYTFQVDIERSGSQGFAQMKVFCYDLMLAQLWAIQNSGPGFLIHDSTIFDGVDERQVALALQLARVMADRYGFQYIACLNSDSVPWDDFEVSFDLRSFVRLTLSDSTEDGGLLGMRY